MQKPPSKTTVELQAFKCICKNCNLHFEALNFHDFEYGRRILRTRGGKHIALLTCNDDGVFEEFSSLLKKIAPCSSASGFAALFNKTFGMTCDPIEGESIDASQKQTCPRCGSDSINTYDIVPRKFVSVQIPRITHLRWQEKTISQREMDIRAYVLDQ